MTATRATRGLRVAGGVLLAAVAAIGGATMLRPPLAGTTTLGIVTRYEPGAVVLLSFETEWMQRIAVDAGTRIVHPDGSAALLVALRPGVIVAVDGMRTADGVRAASILVPPS